MDYGIVHSAAALVGPLELLSIVPAKDKGRLQIAGSRRTGFSASRTLLIQAVRRFLTNMCDEGADDWEPPDDDDDDDNSDAAISQ